MKSHDYASCTFPECANPALEMCETFTGSCEGRFCAEHGFGRMCELCQQWQLEEHPSRMMLLIFARLARIIDRHSVEVPLAGKAKRRVFGGALTLVLSAPLPLLWVLSLHTPDPFTGLGTFFLGILGITLFVDGFSLHHAHRTEVERAARWRKVSEVDRFRPGFADYYHKWQSRSGAAERLKISQSSAAAPGAIPHLIGTPSVRIERRSPSRTEGDSAKQD